MIKKAYLRPTTNVVEVKIVQLVCASLRGVSSTGLDKNETLDYGDEDGTTEKDVWENAW
jgi:hypothetical protein